MKETISQASLFETFKKIHPQEEYLLGNRLGSGSFSVVRQCCHKQTQNKHAIKVVDKKQMKSSQIVENEIRILQKASHPNIIQLNEIYETPETLYLVMELVEGGELYYELLNSGPFSEEKACKIFIQVVQAIGHLHSLNVAHRDLKLENILYNKKTDEIKITDFGLSKNLDLSDEEMMSTRCGTATYVAPEIVNALPYTKSIDIWSLGIVLYLLLHCLYPFSGDSLAEIYEKIAECKVTFPTDVKISEEAKDLILTLLRVDPNERPSIEQILAHPWIQKYKGQDSTCCH